MMIVLNESLMHTVLLFLSRCVPFFCDYVVHMLNVDLERIIVPF